MAPDDPRTPDRLANTRLLDPQSPPGELVLQPRDPRPPVDNPAVPLWIAIRNRRTDYTSYQSFIARVLGQNRTTPWVPERVEKFLKFANAPDDTRRTAVIDDQDNCLKWGWLGHGLHAYDLLKTATEVYLMLECGVLISGEGPGEIRGAESSRVKGTLTIDNLRAKLSEYLGLNLSPQRLPYIQQILGSLDNASLQSMPFNEGVLRGRVECPCMIELIWSYWHEEAMLVQGMNALSMRFQNRRIGDGRDPLAQLELSPLRPLNPIFWGYVQDEQHRLSLLRRSHEYEHAYGISLRGKAVPVVRAADRRSKFIEALHDLLFRCAQFYQLRANLQYDPDPFPLLNGLKEVHLLLSQGAGNQFGDLPWTARVEMLMQQWILARPEVREFVGRRPMVAYPEEWMGNAESLKSVMGWTDTSVVHFRNLGVFGEQLLLSIRWHAWSAVDDSNVARDWANYWRPEIQGYMHAYRAATGVDLTLEPKDSRDIGERKENPAVLLERRLGEQRNGAA